MSKPLLQADGLSKNYGDRGRRGWDRFGGVVNDHRPALRDVSLTLHRGEVLGIVGESGSGKTTLARCLTLLERPDAGQVVFDGRNLTALRGRSLRRERRRIQIIFQDPYAALNPRLTVRSTLREVLRVHRLVPQRRFDARVTELLELVGLSSSIADRYPADFSGGQRQRICIARALAAEPILLVADEAVSSLDVSIQAQVLNLLMRLRDELGLTMIFISHDLHVVRRLAPSIAVMFGGRIVEMLPPGVSLEHARHPYTAALLAALPRLATHGFPATDTTAFSSALPVEGCPFRERCPSAFDLCSENDPPLLVAAGGQTVACHDVVRRDLATRNAVST